MDLATEDADLAVSGDPAAVGLSFEEFFVANHRHLYAAMWLVTRNQHEAEEIAQEAFLRLLERWDRVSMMEDPVGYLYRTATNHWRSRGRRSAVALRRVLRARPAPDELEQAESRADVVRILSRLTGRQRAAIVLVDLVGLSSADAVKALGVRPSTIRVQAARARAALKERLSDE
jgi:RNA polymerase sigma-70 factor, ECF subfamily